ncbi:hypothetical protein M378DRAFT_10794 [Amanita muscaria Koide BX008]|uniref:Uncharacterized protein n=1 Tax=Amanita muscaria (strain Koide BX008) TaxID=946122 RepID=A0A0C2X9E0_AMAMK|nr:hypothetical protein M378DRAFT_10794 [Amanita muscaria Koide BX008]
MLNEMTGAFSLGMHGGHVELSRIPPRPYRHAAPSAPWPWIDINDKADPEQPNTESHLIPKSCDHTRCEGWCWKGYPQSRFPNWTPSQVEKFKIREAIDRYDRSKKCTIFKLDVDKQAIFNDAGHFVIADADDLEPEWDRFKSDKQGDGLRIRALFVENLTGPALRMLGAKYDIEPSFFSSPLNWIPSHHQEDLKQGCGDPFYPVIAPDITLTLPFIRSLPDSVVPRMTPLDNGDFVSQMIDPQAQLRLESNHRALVLDLLSVYLVRNVAGNTIISFHANIRLPTTKASYLHERIRFAGQSVYWQRILKQTDDPTFLMLIFLWHVMYAWEEALHHLYEHIGVLEITVVNTARRPLTEVYIIRAHLLYYSSLLVIFKKVVQYILDTPNPALTPAQRSTSDPLMKGECNTLLEEIGRLKEKLQLQERRLNNVIQSIFTSVHISDGKIMQEMTEVALRTSTSMVFLPAIFVARIFSMKVSEIDPGTNVTIAQYFELTIPVTMATVWIVMAYQSGHIFPHLPFWKRLGWPIYLLFYLYNRQLEKNKLNEGATEGTTEGATEGIIEEATEERPSPEVESPEANQRHIL